MLKDVVCLFAAEKDIQQELNAVEGYVTSMKIRRALRKLEGLMGKLGGELDHPNLPARHAIAQCVTQQIHPLFPRGGLE